jgi:Cys-tRNA synthase (O-phospho-L-seryl-tRNA:Cys-tRNA synthase)
VPCRNEGSTNTALLAEVESVSERIRAYDEQIENIAKSRYPETALLQQVHGVDTLTR